MHKSIESKPEPDISEALKNISGETEGRNLDEKFEQVKSTLLKNGVALTREQEQNLYELLSAKSK